MSLISEAPQVINCVLQWGSGFFLFIDEPVMGTYEVQATPFVMDGTWKHIAAGRTSTEAFLYVNGGTPDTMADTTLENLSDSTTFKISRTVDAWNGDIDDVRVYRRVLSAAEINALANGDMPGSGLGTYTLQDNLDVNGTLQLNDGTLDVGSNRQINVAGNWANFGGVFSAQTGTVVLDGVIKTFQPPKRSITSRNKSHPQARLLLVRQSTITIGGTFAFDGFDTSNYLTFNHLRLAPGGILMLPVRNLEHF